MQFSKLSASKRDSDQNSEFDRYESRLSKRDEGLAIQNKVAAEQTVRLIVQRFGEVPLDEVEFFKKNLTTNGAQLINPLQIQLLGYCYYKDFGDPVTFRGIRSSDYIRLMVCARRSLLAQGMVILPYIISGKVTRVATRKIISKKDTIKYERNPLFTDIKNKYNNDPKLIDHIWQLIGTIVTSNFTMIDYDEENHCAGPLNGQEIPMINDLLYEEMLMYIINI